MWSRVTKIILAASCFLLAVYVAIWRLSGTWRTVNEAPVADGAVVHHRWSQKPHSSAAGLAGGGGARPPLPHENGGLDDLDSAEQSHWLESLPRKGFDLYHHKYVCLFSSVLVHASVIPVHECHKVWRTSYRY